MDKELQQVYPPEDGNYSLKIVDKLVKVYTKNGQEEYILVHVEVQGQYREDFGKRMFSYYYRLFDKYDKPITAYAIFTEATTIARPDIFRMELLGTIMNYKFNIYKIADQNDAELMASDNPFALVVLAAKTVLSGKKIKDSKQRDQLFLVVKIDLIRRLLSKRLTKLKIRKILSFINYYIKFDS